MNKKQVEGPSRDLMEAHFERVAEAIKGGKETNSLTYPELSEELVEKFKGKTLNAPLEVVFTSCLFLTAQELVGLIETLKELAVMFFSLFNITFYRSKIYMNNTMTIFTNSNNIF